MINTKKNPPKTKKTTPTKRINTLKKNDQIWSFLLNIII